MIQKQKMEDNDRVPLKLRPWLYTLGLYEEIQVELVYGAGKVLILRPLLNKKLRTMEAFVWIFI